jgi:catechol 2,3-dioxygenase-like lactoylglutathione lyase family enzyme
MKLNSIRIKTKHLEASIDFYVKLFHFELIKRYKIGNDLEGALLKHNACLFDFLYGHELKTDIGQALTLTFEVEDLDSLYKKIIRQKIEIVDEPHMNDEGKRVMHIKDINGLVLGLIQES